MFVAGIDAHATYSVIAIVSNTGQLVEEPGPRFGAHPPAPILGEQTPTLQMKPDVVELGILTQEPR